MARKLQAAMTGDNMIPGNGISNHGRIHKRSISFGTVTTAKAQVPNRMRINSEA